MSQTTYTYCCAVCGTRSEETACPNCYFDQLESAHTLVQIKCGPAAPCAEPDVTTPPGPVHGKNMYLVDRIVQRAKVKRGGWRYLVQWTGYPESENTWEPLRHVQRTNAFADFMKLVKAETVTE